MVLVLVCIYIHIYIYIYIYIYTWLLLFCSLEKTFPRKPPRKGFHIWRVCTSMPGKSPGKINPETDPTFFSRNDFRTEISARESEHPARNCGARLFCSSTFFSRNGSRTEISAWESVRSTRNHGARLFCSSTFSSRNGSRAEISAQESVHSARNRVARLFLFKYVFLTKRLQNRDLGMRIGASGSESRCAYFM